jgi:uncharacterized protein YjlB
VTIVLQEAAMIGTEDAKRIFEKLTGFARPSKDELPSLLQRCEPASHVFADDGKTPNNPDRPFLYYSSAVVLGERYDPAAVLEEIFASNGWEDYWRDGIYDFLHFHTGTHEVLGIARGTAKVMFGGDKGRTLELKAGDVVVLPAGTGHRRLAKSDDLLVVGAYPAVGHYDEPKPHEVDHVKARATIATVPVPEKDPLYGSNGPLVRLWTVCSTNEHNQKKETTMAVKKKKRKYSKAASASVEGAMKKRKAGTLRSGRSVKKVKSKKQAIAIGLSEARAKGKKVPKRKKASAKKKKKKS